MSLPTSRAARAAGLAAAVAGLTMAVGTITPATAAPASTTASVSTTTTTAPRFLSPTQMPPHPASAWYASSVARGLPDPPPFCVAKTLPSSTLYRNYWTEFDTTGGQYTVTASSEAKAKELAAKLRLAVRVCAANYAKETGGTATLRYYGTLDVEEGANVYGIHTSHPSGPSDINMFGVGRDGRDVTVVRWGQMGNFQHAQVADFKKTTTIAVNKLR
ncbi:hypothetical protein AQ490_03925 [Wenjunlia vitaminophila]|uniref:Uncharacterized protein n=1 Tax=Wenjunlia vitaminophila TaxID=76728 RepID=A0A0T6LRJ6_WENVI|nr:hypothetical protein [Wenjunlia vitaminophila]KRV48412.1 hypothetical protein AQ490_03925 [Wenjunlia vitaminophila]